MATEKTQKPGKSIEQITHTEAKRKNIPTVEHQSVMQHHEQAPVKVKYPRGNNGMDDEKVQRNRDLDPQLVWRGKDQQDWSDLVVNAPPLYIQEKVKPKVLIDDLRRVSEAAAPQTSTLDLFGDFNGLPEGADRTEFYQHEGHWQNRMILGDSLQVMASLAEREGLRGKVQCIYFDPPYGIKFNSNFQWSTADRSNSNDAPDKVTREPEQVKAFRDTWRDGIHSYLTYLRDRLNVARDLLTDSGSIFVQIGDENLHRVRALMDEVFGDENFISIITFKKTHYLESDNVSNIADYLVLFAKDIKKNKHKKAFRPASLFEVDYSKYTKAFTPSGVQQIPKKWREDPSLFAEGWRPFRSDITLTQDGDSGNSQVIWSVCGSAYLPGQGRHWRTHELGRNRLYKAGRVNPSVSRPFYIEGFDDSPSTASSNIWTESLAGAQGKIYVVQTNERVLERCILMASDPGDLVLDPTCGSGTTAYVAEQWGRRWITIDTSRVALALARARIMGARYPFYLLADSPEGQLKEAQITRSTPSSKPTFGNIAHGFVYERVPHITLKSIANNAEIDVIWDKFQTVLEPLREQLNTALKKNWQEWEIPREVDAKWSDAAKKLHADWWEQRIARQKEIDASIAAKAEFEFLYDKPYEDKKRVRVAGPFTVESLSPHRVLGVDEEDNLIDHVADTQAEYGQDFASLILANLRTAGVQQAHKVDKIEFTSLEPWPGELVCAEGRYLENGQVKRAGILVGPEFGTVTRADLVDAAREAGDANFDVLIACAFNFDAPASEFSKLGRINVLKARMNADLHMAEDLKNTGKGNLFVIFGEPDVDVLDTQGRSIRRYDGKRDVIEVPADGQLVVRINGVDVFHPSTGEVRSDGADGIACWFLDTDYNEESFFVRHAYFLGANDPYKALKTTLKAEIDPDAWATLNSDTSRPFPKPSNGRFAVKVINHLGDEVMKVFKVN
ncbi:site-specific DNA-methyltransferase [Pseudomonas aeruginosa]|uniref:site-specific DNA-methyltransferase n=1 Tax=Pseudomonas aeruginosa TaxID=287 RepID=UPI00053E2CF5|nr:site-specific DNA-methyltransferase [Pseudomonas aeruginosa]